MKIPIPVKFVVMLIGISNLKKNISYNEENTMGKIFKFEELNLKKLQHVEYSETYEVRFSIQKPDGFWTQDQIIYHAKSKSAHKDVEKRWREDNKNQNVKLIRINYQ